MLHLVVVALCSIAYAVCSYPFSIALHGQVAPNDNGKIVGSVITTAGLQKALLHRASISAASVYYPSSYKDYFNVTWDVLLIEGWFPSISEFISVNRNHNPNVLVVYYCLDPAYPNLETILNLDVNGIMTNSRQLFIHDLPQHNIPASFHMLAADTNIMAPDFTNEPIHSVVYVGAAGHMLVVKPNLLNMLLGAKPFGLKVFGSGWNRIDSLREHWGGVLPKDKLAWAYSRARVVLTSTIQAQEEIGMINNRVFEALACGAVVVSEESPTLRASFGDTLVYFNKSNPISEVLHRVLFEWTEAELLAYRRRGRQIIVEQHNWAHRVLDMENFFLRLRNDRDRQRQQHIQLNRANPSRALVLVSKWMQQHRDYITVILPQVIGHLQLTMHVDIITDNGIPESLSNISNISAYELVLYCGSAFDAFDLALIHWPFPVSVRGGGKVQRKGAYLLGVNEDGRSACIAQFGESACLDVSRYDAIFYRDAHELKQLQSVFLNQLPKARLQHMFGLDLNASIQSARPVEERPWLIFVCYRSVAHLCTVDMRRHDVLAQRGVHITTPTEQQLVVLLGGDSLHDWQVIEQQLHASIVNVSLLHRVIHVPDSAPVDHLAALFRDAHAVVFMNALMRNISASSPVNSAGASDEDAMSLLVMAAVSQTRVHLLQHHEAFIHVASRGVAAWDRSHLQLMRKNGFDRLIGLPPAKAIVSLQPLHIQYMHDHQSWSCADDDVDSNSASVCAEQDREFLTIPVVQQVLSRVCGAFALVRVNTVVSGFRVGFDGLLCIKPHGGRDADLVCLLRDIRYMAVVLSSYDTDSGSCSSNVVADVNGDVSGGGADAMQVQLDYMMRGNLFADFVQQHNMNLSLVKPPATSTCQVCAPPDQTLSDVHDDLLVYYYKNNRRSNSSNSHTDDSS